MSPAEMTVLGAPVEFVDVATINSPRRRRSCSRIPPSAGDEVL